jgi:hypothetical protein
MRSVKFITELCEPSGWSINQDRKSFYRDSSESLPQQRKRAADRFIGPVFAVFVKMLPSFFNDRPEVLHGTPGASWNTRHESCNKAGEKVRAGFRTCSCDLRGKNLWEKPNYNSSLDNVQSEPRSKAYPIGIAAYRTRAKEDEIAGRRVTYTKEGQQTSCCPTCI